MRYFKEPEKGAPTPADALSIPQPLFLLLLLLLIRQLLFHSIILDIYSIYPPPFSPFRLFYYFIYYVFCRSNKETNPGRADQHVFRSTCSDVLRPLEIGRADENVGKCRTGDKTESYCISSETFQRPKKMQRNPILHVFSFEPSTSKTELSLASV